MMNLNGLRVALVGPLPPPEGGMANQTRQLGELLAKEGAQVTLVRVNAPYRPRWIGRLRGVRAFFRLVPYVFDLWRAAGRVDLFHVMANSGWSWHLFAAPAVWVARLRGVPCVVNYRGGEADSFLDRSASSVLRTLRKASALAVPSGYLQQVFARHGLHSEIVANIVDVERFRPGGKLPPYPHIVVARGLESIYDIGTALRAFALLHDRLPAARMSVAGSGPEERALRSLAFQLAISEAVQFCGRLDRDDVATLYRSAWVALNPSRVDNMPNSVLEAMASGTPVVSTNVGGVPFIIRDGLNGLLVPPGDYAAMGEALQRVVCDPQLADSLRSAALTDVGQYTWSRVRQQWADVYGSAASSSRTEAAWRIL
ncbi:MAG TPA: glycosyltransferase family 4 protein [Burkholderiales bacterium]|jgi:glycosyltransferase involved in cell wall biosynthesis